MPSVERFTALGFWNTFRTLVAIVIAFVLFPRSTLSRYRSTCVNTWFNCILYICPSTSIHLTQALCFGLTIIFRPFTVLPFGLLGVNQKHSRSQLHCSKTGFASSYWFPWLDTIQHAPWVFFRTSACYRQLPLSLSKVTFSPPYILEKETDEIEIIVTCSVLQFYSYIGRFPFDYQS